MLQGNVYQRFSTNYMYPVFIRTVHVCITVQCFVRFFWTGFLYHERVPWAPFRRIPALCYTSFMSLWVILIAKLSTDPHKLSETLQGNLAHGNYVLWLLSNCCCGVSCVGLWCPKGVLPQGTLERGILWLERDYSKSGGGGATQVEHCCQRSALLPINLSQCQKWSANVPSYHTCIMCSLKTRRQTALTGLLESVLLHHAVSVSDKLCTKFIKYRVENTQQI